MREIRLDENEATLSAVAENAHRGETTVIVRHGRPEAVVVGFDEWQRLASVPSFGRLLMASGLRDGDLPDRDETPLRDIDP